MDNTMLKEFGDTAIKLARNPLGILALLIVLVYGIAGLVASSDSFQNQELNILVWFLVLFPVIVLFVLLYLVTKHHDKLYAPSDFADEAHFVKLIESKISDSPKIKNMSMASNAIEEELGALVAKNSDIDTDSDIVLDKTAPTQDSTSTLQSTPTANSSSNPIGPREIDGNEEKVLIALRDGKYTYRSVSGISKDAGLNGNKVRDLIFSLQEEGLIAMRDKGGGPKYFLNNNGRKYLSS
jgi:hypothetical protein